MNERLIGQSIHTRYIGDVTLTDILDYDGLKETYGLSNPEYLLQVFKRENRTKIDEHGKERPNAVMWRYCIDKILRDGIF